MLLSRMYQSLVNPYVLLGVFFIALFVTSYFIDLHVDIAQALMVTFLAEHELDMGYTQMSIAKNTLKNAINDIDVEQYRKDMQKTIKH